MNVILLIIVLLTACISPKQKAKETTNQNKKFHPESVIFDTDLGNDIDDVLALQMILNYHKKGIINLIGITISKTNPLVVQYVDGYCNYHDLPGIPVGYAYHGVNPDEGEYLRQTLETIYNNKRILQPKRSLADSIPEGFVLIRNLLSSQKDSSVTIIAVGPHTNLANLIKSEPDQYSQLSGARLVEKKVKLLSLMGGCYEAENEMIEWNILQDLISAQTVFNKWPTKIIASGWEVGNALLYPHQSIENDFNEPEKHPLCISYKAWGEMPYDRPTWDLTSVLVSVEADKEFFEFSPKGTITITDKGKSLFSETANGKHFYLIHKKSKTQKVLDALIDAVTCK